MGRWGLEGLRATGRSKGIARAAFTAAVLAVALPGTNGTVLIGPSSGLPPLGLAAGPGASGLLTASLPPCRDGGYALYPAKWTKAMNWYFNAVSTPSNVTQAGAAIAFSNGANNITSARNDCGLRDQVSATNAYKGATTRSPNISSTATCLSPDGVSVVGFGDLPSTMVGYACWWSYNNATTEADIVLNKVDFAWSVNVPAGCSNRYIIQDVATHEFGHAFGLTHVSESTHGGLTMSPTMMPCQTAEETLGLGDINGLNAKY
jgi:hypothetical protein